MSQEDFELPSEGDFSVENGSEFSSDESTLSLRFSLMREANLNKAHINYIDIPRNSTYKAATRIINSCIGRLNESLTLLVQNDGPWPCWKSPKPDEKISFQTSTLLAVDGENPFIIALLRTEVEDAPLIIGNVRMMTLSEDLTSHRVVGSCIFNRLASFEDIEGDSIRQRSYFTISPVIWELRDGRKPAV